MAEFVEVMGQFNRMCRIANGDCEGCEIGEFTGCIDCAGYVSENPESAEEIILKWAAKHPRKTMRDVLLENFPNVQLNRDGTPPFCVRELGLPGQKDCARPCKECWNSPAPEE